MSHDHPHAAIARRLKRANGHLDTIVEMIEQGRPCAQIAQQLQAVGERDRERQEGADPRSHRAQPGGDAEGIRAERASRAARFQAGREVSVIAAFKN
ncbi:hypothetical protein ACVIWU_007989 [Bradyrhizobium sp. USDA 4509]